MIAYPSFCFHVAVSRLNAEIAQLEAQESATKERSMQAKRSIVNAAHFVASARQRFTTGCPEARRKIALQLTESTNLLWKTSKFGSIHYWIHLPLSNLLKVALEAHNWHFLTPRIPPGAAGGNRTLTPLLETDFESVASTNSAIAAGTMDYSTRLPLTFQD